MKITILLSAALAATTLAGVAVASTAHATPTTDRGEYVNRAARSPNGKDMFVRIVKVPRAQATAKKPDCPMMDPAHCAQPKAAKPQVQG